MAGWLALLGTILLCAAILGGAVWFSVRRVRRAMAAARGEPAVERAAPAPLQPPPVNDNDTLIAALDALIERRHPESESARSGPSKRSRPPSLR